VVKMAQVFNLQLFNILMIDEKMHTCLRQAGIQNNPVEVRIDYRPEYDPYSSAVDYSGGTSSRYNSQWVSQAESLKNKHNKLSR
jgi:hypothetical protein